MSDTVIQNTVFWGRDFPQNILQFRKIFATKLQNPMESREFRIRMQLYSPKEID